MAWLGRSYPAAYKGNMKIKTSITLPEEILEAVDRVAERAKNRSAVIERAVREFLASQGRRQRDARDREILDRHARRLNREAQDVLAYQVEVRGGGISTGSTGACRAIRCGRGPSSS